MGIESGGNGEKERIELEKIYLDSSASERWELVKEQYLSGFPEDEKDSVVFTEWAEVLESKQLQIHAQYKNITFSILVDSEEWGWKLPN